MKIIIESRSLIFESFLGLYIIDTAGIKVPEYERECISWRFSLNLVLQALLVKKISDNKYRCVFFMNKDRANESTRVLSELLKNGVIRKDVKRVTV